MDYVKEFKKNQTLILLTEYLKNKNLSISELQKLTEMKRSTLNYYLTLLEAKGFISRERIEKGKTGQPTILKFNKEVYEKQKIEQQNKWKKREEEYNQRFLSHPLTKKILSIIEKNPELDIDELSDQEEIKLSSAKYEILKWLHSTKFIKESFKITEEGKKFLKDKK